MRQRAEKRKWASPSIKGLRAKCRQSGYIPDSVSLSKSSKSIPPDHMDYIQTNNLCS